MAFENLSRREQEILKAWQEEGKKRPSLATSLSVKLFELFMHGIDVFEIVALNKGAYLVEQVLEARVRDRWDERRNEYLDTLFGNVVGRVSQAQAESVGFLTDMLAVAHRMHGSKLKAYLQTGDEAVLGDFTISGWQNYKGVVDTLMKLTGQDKEKSGAKALLSDEEKTSEVKALKVLPPGGVKVLDAADALAVLGALTPDD